jgi:hypothetical protein
MARSTIIARRFSCLVTVADWTDAMWYSLRLMHNDADGIATLIAMTSREADFERTGKHRFKIPLGAMLTHRYHTMLGTS